jgi:hypothetical protein
MFVNYTGETKTGSWRKIASEQPGKESYCTCFTLILAYPWRLTTIRIGCKQKREMPADTSR